MASFSVGSNSCPDGQDGTKKVGRVPPPPRRMQKAACKRQNAAEGGGQPASVGEGAEAVLSLTLHWAFYLLRRIPGGPGPGRCRARTGGREPGPAPPRP